MEDLPAGKKDTGTGEEYHVNREEAENNSAKDKEGCEDDTTGTGREEEITGESGKAGRTQTERPGTPVESFEGDEPG